MDDVTGENLENMYSSIYDDNAGEMRGIFSFLLTYIFMYVTAEEYVRNDTSFVEFLGQGIQTEIQNVKQPIDETIAYVGSSQCKHVKKLLGVSYEQLQGEKEPDLNTLSVVYKAWEFTTKINITAAAEILRQARKYEATNKLIMFIHGFTDDPYKDSFSNITQAFFEKGHTSTIALDGSSLIRWLYLRSTTYVQFIGRKLGEMLASMVYKGQDPALIHIIGHSLGAHIAGFAGKTFYNLTGFRIGRISGLDPAGPCFSHIDENSRLKTLDADYIDVIHSDGGVYGIRDPIGDADYYPNNGMKQPNCLFQTCSHSRSWLLYAVSVIFPEAFPAVKCENWEAFKEGKCDTEISYMGFSSKPGLKGLFYLQTSGKYPFSLGTNGIKYRNTDGIVGNIGNILGKTSSGVINGGIKLQENIGKGFLGIL